MTNRITAIFCIAVMFVLPDLFGKEPKGLPKDLDLAQRYFVSECVSFRHCVEKVLNPGGAARYRFAGVGTNEGYDYESGHSWDSFLVVMEKARKPGVTFEYRIAPLTQENFSEAASQGFRLVWQFPLRPWGGPGAGFRPKAGLTIGASRKRTHGALMEKTSRSDSRFQYLVLGASRSWPKEAKLSVLFGEMEQAVGQGFEVVQLTKHQRGYFVVLERPAISGIDVSPALENVSLDPSTPRFRLLSTWKMSTLQGELEGATGYRLAAADLDALELLLELAPASGHGLEYEVATGRLIGPLERSMNEIAARGFRLHSRSMGAGFMVMEKHSGSTLSYQYQILETARLSTMRKELAEAVSKGFAVVLAIRHDAGQALVLERRREPGEP